MNTTMADIAHKKYFYRMLEKYQAIKSRYMAAKACDLFTEPEKAQFNASFECFQHDYCAAMEDSLILRDGVA